MPKVALYHMDGNDAGTIELNESVFGIEPNKVVIHQVVKNYLANQRQGTQSTLTRTEVRGGGIKPWRQKGTGRARQGSIRSPQWKGGGVALGPKPRDYRYSLNKKVKQLAVKSVLSLKVLDNELKVIDMIDVAEIKTKTIAEMIKNLNISTKALIVVGDKNENVYKSARNIKGVKATFVGSFNIYDALKYETIIASKDAIAKFEEVYA